MQARYLKSCIRKIETEEEFGEVDENQLINELVKASEKENIKRARPKCFMMVRRRRY